MSRREEIILHLESVDQLVTPRASSPFPGRKLKEDAEKFIVGRAANLPRGCGAKLIVYLPESQAAAAAHDVREAVRQHFAFRRDEAEKELGHIRRFGWRSLLIALMFLSLTLLLVEIIKRYAPAGNLSSVIQEGLAILAWVALWRPGELLLYEWYPPKRDAKLFGKLEQIEVRIVAETD